MVINMEDDVEMNHMIRSIGKKIGYLRKWIKPRDMDWNEGKVVSKLIRTTGIINDIIT